MKSVVSIMLALMLTLTACGTQSPDSSSASGPADVSVSVSSSGAQSGQAADPSAQGTRYLVAYFSATGNTKNVAEHLESALGAGLYEIVPEQACSSADLDYNSDCRANREQNDPSARPAISGEDIAPEDYDVIFLGYPIWWGKAPKIICTFLERYDFTGKTIVPFCTSGSSGIGGSLSEIQALAPSADWLDGQRFSGSASLTEVQNWVEELNLTT